MRFNYISVLWGVSLVYNLNTRTYQNFYVIKNFRLHETFDSNPQFTQCLSDICVTGCYPVNNVVLEWLRRFPNDAIYSIPHLREVA